MEANEVSRGILVERIDATLNEYAAEEWNETNPDVILLEDVLSFLQQIRFTEGE